MPTTTTTPMPAPSATFPEIPIERAPLLPVWGTVKAGIARTVTHRRSLLQTGLLLLLIMLALDLVTAYVRQGGQLPGQAHNIPRTISSLAGVLLLVVWLRLLVRADLGLTEGDARQGLGAAFGRYFLRSIVTFLPVLLVAGASFALWFGLFGYTMPGPPDSMPPSMIVPAVLGFLIIVWVELRLQLYPVAGAVGHSAIGLAVAWRATEGNVLRLVGILVLTLLFGLTVVLVLGLLGSLISLVAGAGSGGLDPTALGRYAPSVVTTLGQFAGTAVSAGMTAEIYARLVLQRAGIAAQR